MDFLKPIISAIVSGALVLGSFFGISAPHAEEPTLGAFRPSGYTGKLLTRLNEGGVESSFNTTPCTTPDGQPLYNAALGDYLVITINPGASNEEKIAVTGVACSGTTATWTISNRGLSFASATTTVTANKKQHAVGETVIISDDDHFTYTQLVDIDSDQTITGYKKVPTPLSGTDAANKDYVDTLVNGGTVSNARISAGATAGETIAAGDIVAYRKSDGRWYLADNDLPNYLVDSILGVAQGAGTTGNAITNGVLLGGLDENQSGLTAGQRYFISGTAGDLTTSTTTIMVGQARTTTQLYVDFKQANPYYFAGLGYTFPSTQGASSTALLNNGSGSLTWNGISQLFQASSSPVTVPSAASTTVLTATIPANAFSTEKVLRAKLSSLLWTGRINGDMFIEVGYGNATTSLNYRLPNVGPTNPTYEGEIVFTSIAESASVQRNMLSLSFAGQDVATTTIATATSTTAADSTQARALNVIVQVTGTNAALYTFYGVLEMLRK